jgi:hypothetical protein
LTIHAAVWTNQVLRSRLVDPPAVSRQWCAVPFVRVHVIELPSDAVRVFQGEVDNIEESLRDPTTGEFFGFSDSNTRGFHLCPKQAFDEFINMWPQRER